MAKLFDLINRVIVGSMLMLTPGEVGGSDATEVKKELPDNSILKVSHSEIENITPKLIFDKSQVLFNGFHLAAHRSHRSHSSHRSHYSSYSGGQTQTRTPETKQSPIVDTGTSQGASLPLATGDSKSGQTKPTQKKNSQGLGSRRLVQGMKGPDVLELKRLMASKGYSPELNDNYDELLEVMVKDYQSKSNLPIDGAAGPLTIYHLKKK